MPVFAFHQSSMWKPRPVPIRNRTCYVMFDRCSEIGTLPQRHRALLMIAWQFLIKRKWVPFCSCIRVIDFIFGIRIVQCIGRQNCMTLFFRNHWGKLTYAVISTTTFFSYLPPTCRKINYACVCRQLLMNTDFSLQTYQGLILRLFCEWIYVDIAHWPPPEMPMLKSSEFIFGIILFVLHFRSIKGKNWVDTLISLSIFHFC